MARVPNLDPGVCDAGHLAFYHHGEPRICFYWRQLHVGNARCNLPAHPATEVQLAAYLMGGLAAVRALKESP